MRLLRWMTIVLTGLLLAASPASAALGSKGVGSRIALVVGNGDYALVPKLKNAADDAREVARTLRSLGFEVIERTDTSHDDFAAALRDFYTASAEADSALFYYSGHGFQLGGRNYLVPVDAVLRDRSRIESETIRLDDIASNTRSRNRQTLIFLDACRNNPLPPALRSGAADEGLAQLETGTGIFIAFATEPGNVTFDGSAEHSPFTSALLEHIPASGISVSDMMIRVRNSVEVATNNAQIPWDQSSLRSQFYFNPVATEAPVADAGASVGRPSGADAAVDGGEAQMEIASIQPSLLIEPVEPADDRTRSSPLGDATDGGTAEPKAPATEASPDGDAPIIPSLTILSVPDEPATKVPRTTTAPTQAADSPTVAAKPVERDAGSVKAVPSSPQQVRTATGAVRPATPLASQAAVSVDPTRPALVQTGRPIGSAGEAAEVSQEDRATEPSGRTPSGKALQGALIAAAPVAAVPQMSAALARASDTRLAIVTKGGSTSVAPAAIESLRIVGQEVVQADASDGEVQMAALDPKALGVDPASQGLRSPEGEAVDEPDPAELAKSVQQQLSRLGCYRGEVDGDWGSGSERALSRYYDAKKSEADLEEPNKDLLDRLTGEDGIVCRPQPPAATETPAIASRPPTKQPKTDVERPTKRDTVRTPPRETPTKTQKGPKVTKPPSPTVVTSKPPKKPVTQQAASGTGGALKKTITMGGFR